MILFLTSSIGGSYKENGVRMPCSLDNSNHFLDLLKEYWPENGKCLIISSDPDDAEMNDSFLDIYRQAFKMSSLSVADMVICDSRNEDKIEMLLTESQAVILSGGHVPTQNRFFKRIHLKEQLGAYQGVVIGISAGTMNSAETVYAQPELEGEAIDPRYQRYLEGLGLTKISVLPHFQELQGQTLDGFQIVEDISLTDSKIRPFYALEDGSFLFSDGKGFDLYGESYLFENGTITKVCENNHSIKLASE
jgi:peptidase E